MFCETAGPREHFCTSGGSCLNDKAVGQPDDRTGPQFTRKPPTGSQVRCMSSFGDQWKFVERTNRQKELT
jgi:hypothetical protein